MKVSWENQGIAQDEWLHIYLAATQVPVVDQEVWIGVPLHQILYSTQYIRHCTFHVWVTKLF